MLSPHPAPTLLAPDPARRDPWPAIFAVLLAAAMGLCLRGYQLGTSNQAVYLIDALRRGSPDLLRNDWWVNHTLQYHIAYSLVASTLHRAGLLAPVFLIAYMILVLLFSLGWYRLARVLGASTRSFLFSVLLFYFSAGGTGLGMYSFFQDSSFLPSNLANVAMLWGVLYWIERRRIASGFAMGIAAFFHLNHALVALGGWAALGLWDLLVRDPVARKQWRDYLIGGVIVLGFALFNIIPAAKMAISEHSDMPLKQFVDLYVRLRHPHHYDPSTWPLALWITFLWPIPFAVIAWKRAAPTGARQQAARIFLLLMAVNLLALLAAGLFYVSQILIQMSLYRFSIYPKLLSCIATAWLLVDGWPASRRILWLTLAAGFFGIAWLIVVLARVVPQFMAANIAPLTMVAVLCALATTFEITDRLHLPLRPLAIGGCVVSLAVGVLAWWLGVGLFVLSGLSDSSDYLACCDWISDPEHTSVDAIFLVPPQEQEMRLRGRRAIVVDFKCVPHLPAEIVEWQQQLCDVLDLKTLDGLPHRMDRTLLEIQRLYNALPPSHLIEVAKKYHARYIVVEHELTMPSPAKEVFGSGSCHVYDLGA